MGPGAPWWSNILNSSLPPHRLRPDTRPEYQDPVSHTAQKKREKKRKNKKNPKVSRKKEIIKIRSEKNEKEMKETIAKINKKIGRASCRERV